ncbi:MAG: hypothetical protein R6T93_13835 [Trueperaceae bacterium]
MLRRSLRFAGVALAMFALAACTGVPFNPTIEDTFTAQVVEWPGGDPTPRASGITLREGRTVYYRVDTPSARRDLMYAEVVATGAASGLRISLVSDLGFTRAVSVSPDYFSSTFAGLTLSDGEAFELDAVGGRSISAEFACLGPCVAVRATANSYLVKIENTSGSSRTFDLYGYTIDFSDEGEPNDSAGSAVPFSGAGVLQGAIETLGDEDWFLYTGSELRELRFDAFDPALGLELQIDGGGPTLVDGDEDVIYPGERFRVHPADGRAGPSSTSGYAVTVGDVATSPIDATVTAQDTTSPGQLLSASVAAFATRTYRVDVPTARDLLYAEVVGSGLRVRLLTTSGSTLAVSDTPAYFTGGLSRGEAVDGAPGPTPAAIEVQFSCVGPCAAVRPSAAAYLVEVQNLTSSTRSFGLFAYTFDANDSNDRGSASNDSSATATAIPGSGSYSGAIEWLGDEDWFRYTGASDRVLEFTVLDTAPGLRLRFADGTTVAGTLGGLTTNLYPNDLFRIDSGSNRAGPSATSGYFLQVTAP